MAESGKVVDQFLDLAKAGGPEDVARTIQLAINHKSLFVFGELLELKQVQDLAGTSYASALRLLELFAYGTYQDYLADRSSYPSLTGVQLEKLRMLTILSMCSQKRVISLKDIQKGLGFEDMKEVEPLVFKCIFAGLLVGKVDQREERLQVEFASARDVKRQAVRGMISKLQQWEKTLDQLMGTLQADATRLQKEYDAAEAAEAEFQEELARAKGESEGEEFGSRVMQQSRRMAETFAAGRLSRG